MRCIPNWTEAGSLIVRSWPFRAVFLGRTMPCAGGHFMGEGKRGSSGDRGARPAEGAGVWAGGEARFERGDGCPSCGGGSGDALRG